MTTDQSRLARSRLLVADAYERDRAAATKPDPHDAATWLLDQLQELGWKSPPDPATDIPPLRPDRIAAPDVQAAAMAQIRDVLAARRVEA